MALTETFFDNFNDNTLDVAKWNTFNDAAVVLSESNGCLNVAINAATGAYGGYLSNNLFDLTGSYAQTKLVNAGNQSLEMDATPIELRLNADGSNKVGWIVSGNTLIALKAVGAVDTQIRFDTAYVAATHKYFRVRESGGTVYWDFSTDSITWTNYTSELVSSLFSMTTLDIGVYAGIWGSAASTTVTFDDVNIIPVTPKVAWLKA